MFGLDNREIYDVTIIGAGCAGLFAANYAGMRGLKTKVIDFLPKTGGTVSVFYPEKTIYDIGGMPMITGEKLMEQLLEQANMYQPAFVLGQEVQNLHREEDGIYVLTTHDGTEHFTKTVIIAAGAGAFKIRPLKINNGFLREGGHIYYEQNELSHFKGKRVMVYGGLSAAVKRAVDLSKIAEQVFLINNNSKFNVLDEELDELKNSKVVVKTPFSIIDVVEQHNELEKVIIHNSKNGKDEPIVVDDLIISHGYNFDMEAVKSWGFTIENRRIPVNNKMETILEGVYAAGDIAGYPNKWRLISAAFTEAITAVNSAKKFIDPSAPAQVYSTILKK